MAADFLLALLAANLAASAAILLVLILRGLVRRVAGARLALWLWVTPVAAGVGVLAPALPAGTAPAIAPIRSMVEASIGSAASWVMPAAPVLTTSATGSVSQPDLTLALFALWAIGAGGLLALMFWRQRRGVAQFRGLTPHPAGYWLASSHAGPAVIGLLRPRLVTPADFESRFSAREQALVLAHERAHLAAGRTRINAGLALLSCINWFNPLVHLGVRCARIDQELACDAAVVERFPGERRIYAEALLKTQIAPASLPLGCTWPPRSSSLLKERVMMLARKTPGRPLRIAGAGLISVIAFSTAVAGWAQQSPAAQAWEGAPMTAPANPLTMTDAEAWDVLQRLREKDGGPPGVAPADLELIRAQLEARFKKGGPIPAAPKMTPLDRDALLKAVKTGTAPARIANVTFYCDVWAAKYSNVGTFDWNKFNDEAAVVLTIDGDSRSTVAIPDNAFPAGAFPAHGKINADNRFNGVNSISYRLMSSTLIDSLTFIDLDKQIAQVKWERIKLGEQGPKEAFLNGYCRRT